MNVKRRLILWAVLFLSFMGSWRIGAKIWVEERGEEAEVRRLKTEIMILKTRLALTEGTLSMCRSEVNLNSVEPVVNRSFTDLRKGVRIGRGGLLPSGLKDRSD